jgi:GAF domain-containing protein
VSRSADNAAAKAYRSGTLQIVLRRPGSTGAVVAPIMSGEGCVGALSAEIRHGAETSEAVQALAEIAAAHLAGVLGQAPAEEGDEPAAQRAQAAAT